MKLSSASHLPRVASRPWRDGHLRMTDVAMPGTLRRVVRSPPDLVTRVVIAGSLAGTAAGAFALVLEIPPRRGRASLNDARHPIDRAGFRLEWGELAPAVERRRQAVRLEPRSVAVLMLRATTSRRSGDYAVMVRQSTEVLRLGAASPSGEIARRALNERSVR